MLIVQQSDFKSGKYQLAQNTGDAGLLQATIDEFEKKYIYRLLGVPLGTLFISDVDGTTHLPVTTRFLNIFNLATVQVGNRIRECNGMKDMLLAIIYYEYIFATQVRHTQSGVATNAIENGSVQVGSGAARLGEIKYNAIIDCWESTQYFINTNTATYPEYPPAPGQQIHAKLSWIL